MIQDDRNHNPLQYYLTAFADPNRPYDAHNSAMIDLTTIAFFESTTHA
ncbi:MAG TPA: hypothetical protein VMR20_11195 [Verrucomicrobiae bacterium]|nr:hypothetical protein [Verrucomicrobiae bacterium]